MNLDAPGLANAVVRLENFGPEHRDALEASGAIDDMWRWMPVIEGGVSFDNYFASTLKHRDLGHIKPFAVFRQSDDAFAGVSEFGVINALHRRVRISAFWHPPSMRGTLVFPATQCLLIQRALDWGARRIAWVVDTRNEPAFRAFQKLGATHEGTLRSFMRLTDGSRADMHSLSMLRDEAKEAVERLEAQIADAHVA
ncbi:MAG: GNAT family protein [Pseudomonadota bacterium]